MIPQFFKPPTNPATLQNNSPIDGLYMLIFKQPFYHNSAPFLSTSQGKRFWISHGTTKNGQRKPRFLEKKFTYWAFDSTLEVAAFAPDSAALSWTMHWDQHDNISSGDFHWQHSSRRAPDWADRAECR
jgi:hypothetical protein